MALIIRLASENGDLTAQLDGREQLTRTPLAALPAIERLQADPFVNGKTLTAALGGEKDILARIQNDDDNLILLDCDARSDAIAWEFATCSDGQFLCTKAGMLRTVERDAPPVNGDGPLNFIALAADPLVDEKGEPREGYRLDLDNEMRAIHDTLADCGKALEARRIPPTREALQQALRKGPAILHLSCHGNVFESDHGPMATLLLEQKDGRPDSFEGAELVNTRRGVLRLVLLSACKTATGTQANLARPGAGRRADDSRDASENR